MRKISAVLPGMDADSAENMISGGKLAMTLLNYFELNPELLYKLYPNKHKFDEAEQEFGLSQDEIKHQFVTANRRALMVVSYIFKYIANQVIDEYDVPEKHFEFTIENNLMMKDIDENEPMDELDESEVFDELHRILGGLN